MKKTTKFISLLLALVLAVSCFTGIAVFTASAAEQKVYFQYPTDGTWGDASAVKVNARSGLANVLCYAYAVYGNKEEFKAPAWQARSTQCTAVGNNVYSFDLSALGPIEEGADYGIIFSTTANGGFQTCDITMTSDCIGDTIVLTGGTRENAADSQKVDYLASWKNNPQCGVMANITSLGNYVDGLFPFYQPKAQQLSNKLKDYLLNPINEPSFNVENNLSLCEKLGVTALDVYKQYVADFGEKIESGTVSEDGLGVTYYDTKDEKNVTIPSLKNVQDHLALTDEDINPTPTTEPVPTTEPEPTTEPVAEPVFTVVGTSNLVLSGWTASVDSDTVMTKNDDGTYSYTFEGVEPIDGMVQIKVVEFPNGDDSENIWHGANGTDLNVDFKVVSTTDVTVTYNPETQEITVTGDGVAEATIDIDALRTVGNGEGTWLNGVVWDPADDANKMTEVSEGVYEITYTDVADYEDWQVKFAANGGWEINWGLPKETTAEGAEVDGKYVYTGAAAYNGENIKFAVPEEYAGATATIRLDLTNFNASTKEGAVYTITLEKPAPVVEPVFTVVGTSNLVLSGWAASVESDTVMTKNEDGTYSYTFEGVEPIDGMVQIKVVEFPNGDDSEVVWHGANGTDLNVDFKVVSTTDVTVTYNPETGEITVTGDGVAEATIDIDALRTVGNGEGTWLNGVVWDPADDANKMTEVSEGVYEITYTNVADYDDWQVKFAANGGWEINWGLPKETTAEGAEVDGKYVYTGAAAYNGENIKFAVPEEYAGATATIRLDLTNFNASTKEGAVYTITLEVESLGIMGDVNGDGKVDVSDATEIQKAGIELVQFDATQTALADVNQDGRVSIIDVTCIQKYIAGIEDQYSENVAKPYEKVVQPV